jgi:hypothetical protein
MEAIKSVLVGIRVGTISGKDSKQVRRTCYDLFCLGACRRSLCCTVLEGSSLLWGTRMWRIILRGGSILRAMRRSQGVAACLEEPTVSRERRYLTSRLRFKLWIQQRLTATKHDDCAWLTTMQELTRDYSTTLEIRMSLHVFDSVVMKAITLSF